MSMLTMKDFVPKDPPMLSGKTKIFSRLGFILASTDTTHSLKEAPQHKVLLATDRPAGSLEPKERFSTPSMVEPTMTN
jgi:hypothetical protein